MRILISLHRGYGLGDGVQMSAVLRHVAKYRPEWEVAYRAEPGKQVVGRGIVAHTLTYNDPLPWDHIDAEVLICLYDTWANWGDRPNTRVSSCLHEHFGLGWDAECGRYQVAVSDNARANVEHMLDGMWGFRKCFNSKPGFVALHYRGDSSPDRKNLSHEQADQICDIIIALGRVPLIIDWRDTSPVANCRDVATTGKLEHSREWGRDAEMNCAVIAQCEAFIGIDSGPSKCAAATNTQSLVVWTGHHPAPFFDPAPNVVHLVPDGYHRLEPVCDSRMVIDWFEGHYHIAKYTANPVSTVKLWLREVLH